MDPFVSEDQGLICVEFLAPRESLMVDTAWVRVSRGATHLARQAGEFELEIEGVEEVSVKEGTTIAPIQPTNPRLSIRRPIAAPSLIPPPTPPKPSGPRQAVRRETDWLPPTSVRERQFGPTDIHFCERRWYMVGDSENIRKNQRCHTNSWGRAEVPRDRRRLSLELRGGESHEKVSEHRSEISRRSVVGAIEQRDRTEFVLKLVGKKMTRTHPSFFEPFRVSARNRSCILSSSKSCTLSLVPSSTSTQFC